MNENENERERMKKESSDRDEKHQFITDPKEAVEEEIERQALENADRYWNTEGVDDDERN